MNTIYKSAEGARLVRERYLEFLSHWPVPHRCQRVPTREGETFVIDSGDSDAPVLVLLHGSGFNSLTWMGDIAMWSARFRVLAVDVIGEPGLSAPSRPSYDCDRYALWLDDVLTALGVERASLAGISLGGWLALDYALRRPQRVESLVLLAPGGIGRPRLSAAALWLTVLPLLLLGDWGRRKALDKILSRSPRQPQSREAAAVADFLTLIFRAYRPRTTPVPLVSDAQLQCLAMPVLLIVGGRDAMLDPEETRRRVAANLPNAEIHYLPDVGHAVIGQAEPVLAFLTRATVAAS